MFVQGRSERKTIPHCSAGERHFAGQKSQLVRNNWQVQNPVPQPQRWPIGWPLPTFDSLQSKLDAQLVKDDSVQRHRHDANRYFNEMQTCLYKTLLCTVYTHKNAILYKE